MHMAKTPERWTDEGKRIDGLAVIEGGGGFVILPKSDGLAMDRCPCCDKPFSTMRAAMLVADAVYAMTT
jgi:hypothetical protein